MVAMSDDQEVGRGWTRFSKEDGASAEQTLISKMQRAASSMGTHATHCEAVAAKAATELSNAAHVLTVRQAT